MHIGKIIIIIFFTPKFVGPLSSGIFNLQLVSPSSRGPDDTTITPVQDIGTTEKSRRAAAELSRISEDDRHRSSDHHTHTQVRA